MPPKALATALGDGLTPADWYALLNGFVFFWLDRDRLERQRGAYRARAQAVLVFNGAWLLRDFGAWARVSPINSGNARRRPARRGRDTLIEYAAWTSKGWRDDYPRRAKWQMPAEILFGWVIPVRAPYLVRIDKEPSIGSSRYGTRGLRRKPCATT